MHESTSENTVFHSITSQSFSGDLDSDATYTRTTRYTIPPNLLDGIYNVTLYVDYYSYVFEHTYLSNNIEVVQITVQQKLPDLRVENVNATVALDNDNGIARVEVSWLVRNIGQGRPPMTEWVDRVYISDTSHYLDVLGDVSHQLGGPGEEEPGLPPNSFYVASGVFELQIYHQGDVNIIIASDYSGKVLEEDDEKSSNVFNCTLELSHRTSNVSITNVEIQVDGDATEYLFAGQEVKIIWNVVNNGNWPTSSSSWKDALYLSRNDMLDKTAELLAMVEHKGMLNPGESYTSETDVVLFDGIWGMFNILVSIDDDGILWQAVEGYDKISAKTVNIEIPPYSVLSVTHLSHSFSDVDGTRFLSVQWTVSNIGNSMVRKFGWEDAILISDKEGGIKALEDDAYLLGTFKKDAELVAGQVYNTSKTVIIPENLGGSYYSVYVVPDYFESIYTSEEPPLYNEAPPVFIPTIPKADIVASYVSGVPGTVEAGEHIDIVFSGLNIGAPTSDSSWDDSVYLDPSPLTNMVESPSPAALLVAEVTHIGSLVNDETYVVRANVQVPILISGLYDVIIELNSLKEIDEDSYENNVLRVPVGPMLVVSPQLPDLTSSLIDTFTIRAGAPFTLNFNISNTGEGTLSDTPFFNAIYLSNDVHLDPFDVKLISFPLSFTLEPNNTHQATTEVFLPYETIPADYYLLIQIDSRGDIYEVRKDNNIEYNVLHVEEPSTADIIVLEVVPPESPAEYQTEVTVKWKLLNNGTQSADGYKCDTVYLSDDNVWQIEDIEVLSTCESIRLEPSREYSLSKLTTIPLVTPMTYNTIVRSRSNIRDLNLENNIGVSASTTVITMAILNIGECLTSGLSLNEEKLYHVPGIIAEETLLFRLESDTDTDFNEMYLQHGKVVTLGDYEAAANEFLVANQDLAISKSNAGDYFILLRKVGSSLVSEPPDAISQITACAKYADLDILSVSPSEAAPFGKVTLHISGTLLPEEAYVWIESDDGLQITPVDIYHFSGLQMYATFNVTNQEIGRHFSLHVQDRYQQEDHAIFPNALTLIDGSPGILRFRTTNPSNLPLTEETGQVHVFVENVGNTDILTPMLSLDLDGDATFQLKDEFQTFQWVSGQTLYAVPREGPGGIIPPGASSTLVFDVRPNSMTAMRISFTVTELPPLENVNHPFQDKYLLKPYMVDDEAWETVWENYIASVGTSQKSLAEQLSRTANQLSLIGRRLVDVTGLIQHQILLADDYLAGTDLYYETDLSFGNQYKGVNKAEVARYFPGKISHRHFRGLFGRGWRSPYW